MSSTWTTKKLLFKYCWWGTLAGFSASTDVAHD